MLKKGITLGIILLFLCSSIPLLAYSVEKTCSLTSFGDWLYVGGFGPGNYTKIQYAINDASDGDTIFVFDAMSPYHETLLVNKQISLIGENADTTLIDGGRNTTVIYISSSSVNISGFTIQGSGPDSCGIRIITAHNSIHNNIICSSMYNIKLELPYGENKVIYNTISGGSYGIDLRNKNNLISNNIIRENDKYGIIFEDDSAYNLIINNTISNNNIGSIIESGSKYNTFMNNTVMNNERYGIRLRGRSNIVSDNTICDNNKYGIEVYSTQHNTIFNNIISNNTGGIYLNYASFNSFFNNTILTNRLYGIWLSETSNNNQNFFYHNNFIDNDINAVDTTPNDNQWYDDELHEGNYWSDYAGTDSDGDGIGDCPYTIPTAGNMDAYPFMEPNGWLYEPDYQQAFIFGRISHVNTSGRYIRFEAVRTRGIMIEPFSIKIYRSAEKLTISRSNLQWMSNWYIFGFCKLYSAGN